MFQGLHNKANSMLPQRANDKLKPNQSVEMKFGAVKTKAHNKLADSRRVTIGADQRGGKRHDSIAMSLKFFRKQVTGARDSYDAVAVSSKHK